MAFAMRRPQSLACYSHATLPASLPHSTLDRLSGVGVKMAISSH